MLDELLGSRTRARLVTALLEAPDHTLHLRALVRATGSSVSGIQREVARLEAMGLVVSAGDDSGRRQITLQREHPFAGPLASMVAAEATVSYSPVRRDARLAGPTSLERLLNPRILPFVPGIRDAAARFGVARLALFGSSTQNRADVVPRDLDVAVRFGASDPRLPSDLYFDLAAELERLTGLPVDLVESDAVSNPYLQDEIRETEVVLYESP